MVDIAMCRDGECPSRERCYRFNAKADRYQNYNLFAREHNAEKCDSFWPLKTKPEVAALDRIHKD
jgi:hypothetical protein